LVETAELILFDRSMLFERRSSTLLENIIRHDAPSNPTTGKRMRQRKRKGAREGGEEERKRDELSTLFEASTVRRGTASMPERCTRA